MTTMTNYPAVWRIAATRAERDALIALRTEVYRDAQKHVAASEMRDAFDDDAYLIGVWEGNRAIATARVICRPPEQEWEHDRFVQWDDSFPPRQDCCEISRFCITANNRNWKYIRLLSQGISEAMLRSGRRHFIACCTDELLTFYKVFYSGQFMGKTFHHDDLGPKPHHLFRCDYQKGLQGCGMKKLPWLLMGWPSALVHGLHHHPQNLPDIKRLRHLMLVLFSYLEPLAVLAFKYTHRRGRRT
jgi:hypothetical protein